MRRDEDSEVMDSSRLVEHKTIRFVFISYGDGSAFYRVVMVLLVLTSGGWEQNECCFDSKR